MRWARGHLDVDSDDVVTPVADFEYEDVSDVTVLVPKSPRIRNVGVGYTVAIVRVVRTASGFHAKSVDSGNLGDPHVGQRLHRTSRAGDSAARIAEST